MTIWTGCTRCVFRSFKKVERFADRATGHAGPVFITIAIVLIGGCIVTFFDVVFPAQFLAPGTSWAYSALGTVWCTYIVAMFTFHYYKACTVPPGSPSDPPRPPPTQPSLADRVSATLACLPLNRTRPGSTRDRQRERAVREIATAQHRAQEREREREQLVAGGASPTSGLGRAEGDGLSLEERGREERQKGRMCKKCSVVGGAQPAKPERSHHCSVCKQCILKFDHHCPWINQCVGLHNERYFLLFLLYFAVGCGFVGVWGWGPVFGMLKLDDDWKHRTPRTFTLLLWILALVMCFAVGVMGLWQLWLISLGESAVESHDNDYYRKTAKSLGRTFRNPYNLGRKANLTEFFNVGEGGYHWATIFLPLEIPPTSDGWRWRKAEGWEGFAMTHEEELTDEESEGD